MAVDDGAVHALGLAAAKLILQRGVRLRMLRDHDETRRVAIDAVDDERPPIAMRPEMIFEDVDDRCRRVFLRQRHGEQARRFVDDDQVVVFVQDWQSCRSCPSRATCPMDRRAPMRAAGPIDPDADAIVDRQAGGRVFRARLAIVQKDLAADNRVGRAGARSEARRVGEEFVEPRTRVLDGDGPLRSIA